MSKNVPIHVDPDQLALCEELVKALYHANALPARFSWERGGPFGAIHQAVYLSLCHTLARGAKPLVRHGLIARLLIDEMFDNGEDITWQIKMWNENRLTLPEELPADTLPRTAPLDGKGTLVR